MASGFLVVVYCVQQLKEFVGKKLKSATKEGLDIEDDDAKKKLEELKAEFEPLSKLMKEVLGDKLEKVIVSIRMEDSPCVRTASEYGWSANMKHIMKAQAMRDISTTSYLVSKKTMEVNPKHSIMSELKKQASADKSDKTVKWLLFDTSLLTSGFPVDVYCVQQLKEVLGDKLEKVIVSIGMEDSPCVRTASEYGWTAT